jgi:PmbA protein
VKLKDEDGLKKEIHLFDNAGELAQRILEQARKKADSAEVLYDEAESAGVRFQDNQLKSVSGTSSSGVGLRVIHHGRLGFSCTNDFESPSAGSSGPGGVDRLIANALDSAGFGQEARFQFPGAVTGAPAVKVFDAAAAELPMERAVEMMKGAVARVLERRPEAHCGGGVGRESGRSVLCNSAGLHHEEPSTHFAMGVSAFLVRGESFLWVDEGEDSCRFSADLMRHADKVIEWMRLSEREVKLGAEEMPVLFTPNALDFLLATFETNTNGKVVQKGASVLAKRLGERVLDPRVTLWDDPLADYRPGSMAVDDEGVPARRKAIFENGVLKEFLYDLQTAGHMGARSTGNGVRGYSSAPSPGNANVRLAGGSTPYRKILSGLKRGLLIEAALGAGQSNVLAGAFSVNVELGFLVENGEIVGRVKDCMLAGNAFDAFNRIRDLSAETEWHGSAELPYVCFESLSVAGRGG